jgi:hypothetical protein
MSLTTDAYARYALNRLPIIPIPAVADRIAITRGFPSFFLHRLCLDPGPATLNANGPPRGMGKRDGPNRPFGKPRGPLEDGRSRRYRTERPIDTAGCHTSTAAQHTAGRPAACAAQDGPDRPRGGLIQPERLPRSIDRFQFGDCRDWDSGTRAIPTEGEVASIAFAISII